MDLRLVWVSASSSAWLSVIALKSPKATVSDEGSVEPSAMVLDFSSGLGAEAESVLPSVALSVDDSEVVWDRGSVQPSATLSVDWTAEM